MKITKRNQIEILEIKSIIATMKISLEGFNTDLEKEKKK